MIVLHSDCFFCKKEVPNEKHKFNVVQDSPTVWGYYFMHKECMSIFTGVEESDLLESHGCNVCKKKLLIEEFPFSLIHAELVVCGLVWYRWCRQCWNNEFTNDY